VTPQHVISRLFVVSSGSAQLQIRCLNSVEMWTGTKLESEISVAKEHVSLLAVILLAEIFLFPHDFLSKRCHLLLPFLTSIDYLFGLIVPPLVSIPINVIEIFTGLSSIPFIAILAS
jgi:hypothetical protein